MAIRRNSRFKQRSDEELLTAFAKHPNEVLAELFERYHVRCFGLCLKYLENRENAKDAVSELFFKLRNDLNRFEIQYFKSWFYVYSKNYCLGILRKEKTFKKYAHNWNRHRETESPSEFQHPKELPDLNEAMQNLKRVQRICLQRFYYSNESYSEIAGSLAISEKQVKSHLQNGKRNLRLILDRLNPHSQHLKRYE